MSAIDAFLQRMRGVDEAIDFLSQPPAPSPVSVLELLSRGAAVGAFVGLEQFLLERAGEWSAALTMARLPPARLPGGTARFEDRILGALPKRLRDATTQQRSTMIGDAAAALSSLSSASVTAHPLAFSWAGSNVQPGDVAGVLAFVGTDPNRAWAEITAMWSRIDPRFPGNTGAERLFDTVARLRHESAHDSQPNLPLANLLSLTQDLKVIALSVDALVSFGLLQLKTPSTQAAGVRAASIKIRLVDRDGARWPEFPPNGRKAYRRHVDLATAVSEASGRAAAKGELVVARDNGKIVDWRFPAL